MSVLNILRLKILDLLASRVLVVMLLVLPPLFGLLAGTANMANQQPVVRLAAVDQEQNAASLDLITSLQAQGWLVRSIIAEDAQSLLLKHAVDGVITIQTGYADSLSSPDDVHLTYTPAEGSLVTTLVREAIAAVVLPRQSRLVLLGQVEDRYAAIGKQIPPGLAGQFDQASAYYADHQARLDMTYFGATVFKPALTYLVSDYSMEVFFLSIFAILGTLTLSGSALRRRLAATRNGLLLDYCLSIVSLFLLGLVQILLYSLAMLGLMQMPVRPRELVILAVCLLLMLGLGQLLALLHESLRLYFSLLILLLLSVAGGCFFQLSENLITRLGQYLPQGWALAALRGYPVLPVIAPILAALVLLAAGLAAQTVRTRQMR